MPTDALTDVIATPRTHPGPYPTYVQLLTQLGLYPPSTGGSHAFTASITVPTVASLQAQRVLDGLQGQGEVWFAGGYLQPFDAQESALLSAMAVAAALNPGGARLAALRSR